MKTPYTVPVALLVAAIFLGPSAAHARTPTETFEVRFTYNAKAPAKDIYSDLRRTARKACDQLGMQAVMMRHANRACARQVVDAGVKVLARADIAMLHGGRTSTAMLYDTSRPRVMLAAR